MYSSLCVFDFTGNELTSDQKNPLGLIPQSVGPSFNLCTSP